MCVHLHEDNDPGRGVVELAVGVHQADGVHQGWEQRTDVSKIGSVKALAKVFLISHKFIFIL